MKQLGEGWNWRDLKLGDRFITYGRTLFEADLLNFVTLCGFSEELFTNKEYIASHAPMRALVRTTNEVKNQKGEIVLVYTPLRMMQGR